MSIKYIPNDPQSLAFLPMRQQAPRPDRPGQLAGFAYVDAVPEKEYDPGTPEFLFWQCREAALAAVETWEALAGQLTSWQGERRRLQLRHLNVGADLNAQYNRESLIFNEYTANGKTTFAGASTDVVAHEAGHALLDAIRPDLWDAHLFEVEAFHEAFGDCTALLTALADRPTRQKVLEVAPDLAGPNFLEALLEDLADGVRREAGPDHPGAAPRHAFNSLAWQLPTTLPWWGTPEMIIRWPHSFGRVFLGCFYDTIRNIFAGLAAQNAASLWTAAETAGRLLIAAARTAPCTDRFFQAVGRAMVLADEDLHRGAHHLAIRDAFARHDIALGSAAMLAPIAALAGPAPRLRDAARNAILAPATRKDLLQRLHAAPGARLAVDLLTLAGGRVAQAVHKRAVLLDQLDRRLRGVVAFVTEPVLVGAEGDRPAILGRLPEATATVDELLSFVEALFLQGRIALGGGQAAAAGAPAATTPTHAVRKRGERRVLVRIRFTCLHPCRPCAAGSKGCVW
jgi:hypothetical protein